MKINISFNEFKKKHLSKKHQVLFKSRICREYYKVENLFRFLLAEKNSFIFESVEKGKIKGRYTIIGLNPDKIWDVNKNVITINSVGNSISNNLNQLLKMTSKDLNAQRSKKFLNITSDVY